MAGVITERSAADRRRRRPSPFPQCDRSVMALQPGQRGGLMRPASAPLSILPGFMARRRRFDAVVGAAWLERQGNSDPRIHEQKKIESFERISSIRETSRNLSCMSKNLRFFAYRIYPFETFEFFCSCTYPGSVSAGSAGAVQLGVTRSPWSSQQSTVVS